MKKILSFGESLIRYDFDSQKNISIYPTGTSLNFLSNLASLKKIQPVLVTGLSSKKDSEIFHSSLKMKGIENRSFINDYPMGSYQIYRTNTIFGWEVVYNRSCTAWSENKKKLDVNILKGINYLHFDGISLYSSDNSQKVTLDIFKKAINKNIPVLFDFNIRKSMISDMNQIKKIFDNVINSVKFLNISYYDLIDYFGVKDFNELLKNKAFIKISKKAIIIGTKKITLNNNELGISAFKIINNKIVETKVSEYTPQELIGQGDAFAAHSINQYIANNKKIDVSKALEWSIYKTNYIGDSTVQSLKEFKGFKNGKNVYR